MAERLTMRLPEAHSFTGKKLGEGYHVNGIALSDVVGHGGSATVFKGVHPEEGSVAVKVASEKGRPLQNEIIANQVLKGQSSHLVDMIDHGMGTSGAGERQYAVMEYVSGGTVHDSLQKNGPMPAEEVLHYVEQTAFGLQVIHKAGIVHRDVKPSNLLMGEKGIQVADLGIATPNTRDAYRQIIAGEEVVFELDDTGKVMGTPSYMAPEQAQGYSDPRTDVQGLALTAYEMLLGRKFRSGTTVPKAQMDLLLNPEKYTDQVNASVHELERLGYRALVTPMRAAADIDPEQRPEDPQTFYQDLKDRMDEVAHDRNLVARTVFIPGRNTQMDTLKVTA